MIDIQQRLKTIFQTQRLVFWYDDNEALKNEFEAIELDDVTKLTIDNNEFGIKRQVLSLQPTNKFLIYSPNQAPQDKDNWLLDLNIANYMFSADKTSLILENLGLDRSFKTLIGQFDTFFNASSRTEIFKEKISDYETNDSLLLKMMAVSIGCDARIESIVLRIFGEIKHFETLRKFGLERAFFNAVKQKFGYTGDTIKDLLHKLLLNHFYASFDKTKATLKTEARLFVESWMDSSKYAQSFKALSQKVSDELNINAVLAEIDASKVIQCDTYEQCDKVVILYLLSCLNKKSMNAEEVTKIISMREHTFWFASYKNIYYALLSASLLFDFVEQEQLSIQSFDEGIEKYTTHWYQADSYYRDYIFYSNKAEHLELLKSLSDRVEDVYLNGFLRELGDCWQKFADTYSTQTEKTHQQKFYSQYVVPLLHKKRKVFVIISDALRYESGVALSSKINSIDKYIAHCKAMVSSLPSYTQLGMASLLPHQTLSIKEKNDTVFVDGISSAGTASRDKILKAYDSHAKAIGYETFLKFTRDEGRELVKKSSVLYIYHDEIDKMGEKHEIKTFDAVQSAFETLIKIVKQISNFNGSHIFITSDHGFLYTNRPTAESEFCQVNHTGSIKVNRRFIIGKALHHNVCTTQYEGKALGIESENTFLIVKSINKLRVQGGGNRFVHGGATLQELVIPLIEIKKKRVSDVKEVNVEIIPLHEISTNSVHVSLYQSEVVNEKTKPVTLKVSFESNYGVVLSDEFKYTFNSKEQYDTNREVKFTLTFKQDITEYTNQTIKLVARKVLEESKETPLYKQLSVKVVLAMLSEFDDTF